MNNAYYLLENLLEEQLAPHLAKYGGQGSVQKFTGLINKMLLRSFQSKAVEMRVPPSKQLAQKLQPWMKQEKARLTNILSKNPQYAKTMQTKYAAG